MEDWLSQDGAVSQRTKELVLETRRFFSNALEHKENCSVLFGGYLFSFAYFSLR
jgi:hypothetical protein